MTGLLLIPFFITVDAELNRVLKPKPDGSQTHVDDVDMLIFCFPPVCI